MASSSNSSQQEAVMRKQNNGPPYKFLVPLIYAPVLPLNSVDAVWVLMGAVNLVLLKNGQVIYQVQKKAGRNRGVYEPEELGSGREGMGTEF
ncbi:uncharacterized protein LOC107176731 isoform X1 [Citrus sinensis]|uniref:uncharacterized protein LOC107176731 isoform X1 n=1 Tax=Citrus sinensis TaxID=2711 RepID=UPI000D629DCB|nr:uncharacterized protein LOC107176731 isoform X1 [Citrus sinensis]